MNKVGMSVVLTNFLYEFFVIIVVRIGGKTEIGTDQESTLKRTEID